MTAAPDAPAAPVESPVPRMPADGLPPGAPLPVPPPYRPRHGATDTRATTLRGVVRVVRRNLLVLLACLVAGAAAGWGVAAATPVTYETETKVVFTALVDPAAAVPVTQAATLVADQVPTYAALATTPSVLDPAIAASGADVASTELVEDVTAEVVPQTTIVAITVTADSARGAAELANAISASLIEQVQGQSPDGSPVSATGSVVQAPEIPTSPASPLLLLDLVVGLAAGLLVGFLVVVTRQAWAAG
ncbi:hypothetical protein [Geodermatophilus sp. FMUSA9-8]|uniref:hypothetical protein n=1 Tax=Geodermatophilus sp. FMUSA9-8 TaxID=3120155 RepID=UPI003009E0F0